MRFDPCIFVPQPEGTLWIAKPSYANKGSEILVFSSYEELEVHLLEWHSLREWVVQRYIARPLLFQRRKFHFRAYVLAVGAIKVRAGQEYPHTCQF